MGVHVNPAGRHQQAVRIDIALGWALFAADRHDAIAVDRHVAAEGCLACAVGNSAAANDDVMHEAAPGLRRGNDALWAMVAQCLNGELFIGGRAGSACGHAAREIVRG